MGKAFGGAHVGMCSREMGPDLIMAWPTVERAIMGAEGAASIIFRKEIAAAENPKEMKAKLINDYKEQFNNPYMAAARLKFEEIIEPALTRQRIIAVLSATKNKQIFRIPRRHGNIPL